MVTWVIYFWRLNYFILLVVLILCYVYILVLYQHLHTMIVYVIVSLDRAGNYCPRDVILRHSKPNDFPNLRRRFTFEKTLMNRIRPFWWSYEFCSRCVCMSNLIKMCPLIFAAKHCTDDSSWNRYLGTGQLENDIHTNLYNTKSDKVKNLLFKPKNKLIVYLFEKF